MKNMEGNHPLQLDKTCKVAERLENRQYLVKYDQELWVARCTYGGAGGALKIYHENLGSLQNAFYMKRQSLQGEFQIEGQSLKGAFLME